MLRWDASEARDCVEARATVVDARGECPCEATDEWPWDAPWDEADETVRERSNEALALGAAALGMALPAVALALLNIPIDGGFLSPGLG